MRKSSSLAALILALPLIAGAQPAATQAARARDAVAVDPAHHQVVLENDHVRVIRALIATGDRSAMHSHAPGVLVSLATSRSRVMDAKGNAVIVDRYPGQAVWTDATEHSWQMLSGPAHIIRVEVKSAARGAAPASVTLPGNDAVKVDPVHHQVLVENPHVRLLEGLSGTGRKSAMHSHSYGLVIISTGRGRINLTMPDGNSAVFDFHPGQVFWLEPGSHSWEVVSGVLSVIAVEVKSAQAR
jgi:quercetin dioxygenase-like cupin family protein